jgi:hypothetical protein
MPARTAHTSAAACFAAALAAPAALAQVPNDACSSPTPLSGYQSVDFSTAGATSDALGDSGCTLIYNDVWFCWTATATDTVEMATCTNTTWDTKLAVYAGCGCPAANASLTCNDDSCTLQSKISFVATAGQQYMIRLGAYSNGSTGTGTLAIGPVLPLADVTNPANNHRYIAVNATSWSAAEAYAVQLGAHLVSIGDAAENEFVRASFGTLGGTSRRIWIGFNDNATEGTFTWSDGSAASYANWNAGEPNNADAGEDVAEFLGGQGTWNDMPDAGGGYPHIAVIEFGGAACRADLNRDGRVDGADLGEVLGSYGQSGVPADINGDGIVNGADLGEVLGTFGQCP